MIEIISDIQEELANDDLEQADTDTPAKRQKREDSVVVKQENEKETGKDNSKLLQKMLTQLKCLTICKFMLERTEEVFDTKEMGRCDVKSFCLVAAKQLYIVRSSERAYCSVCAEQRSSTKRRRLTLLGSLLSSG